MLLCFPRGRPRLHALPSTLSGFLPESVLSDLRQMLAALTSAFYLQVNSENTLGATLKSGSRSALTLHE